MQLLEKVRSDPKVGGGLAAALLTLALTYAYLNSGESGPPAFNNAYFFDVQSKQLFSQPGELQPPIDAPSGAGNGVLAFVYGCGDCKGELHIHYLKKLTPERKAKPEGQEFSSDGILIASAKDPQTWHKLGSKDSDLIKSQGSQACGSGNTRLTNG